MPANLGETMAIDTTEIQGNVNATRAIIAQNIKRRENRLGKYLLALPAPVILVLFWHFGVLMQWHLPFGIQMAHLPLPGRVFERLWDLIFGGIVNDTFSGMLWAHALASAERVISGFLLALCIGVPLGILMGRIKLLDQMVGPTVNLIRPIPVTAWVPLSLLIIGFGDNATIFLVFLAAVFPIILNTTAAVAQVDPRLTEAGAMLGVGATKMLYKVVLPAALPGIMSGARIGLGLAWVIIVVAEQVGITVGLGSMIAQARDMSKTDLVIAGMICIGLAGFLSDLILTGVVKLIARGRPLISK